MDEAPVLYEDPAVVVVAKPAGVTVIPARNEPPEDSLHHRLMASRGERLWVVHRLDRGTSGVLLFARSAESHAALNAAFESRKVRKRYRALTLGRPAWQGAAIEVALHPARKGKMRPAMSKSESGALPSRTVVRVLNEWKTAVGTVCEVEAMPETGRQHQVRVHLRWAGAPLLVDPLYGRFDRVTEGILGLPGAPVLDRLTLHAWSLTFPSGEGDRVVECPYPNDLAAMIAALVKNASR